MVFADLVYHYGSNEPTLASQFERSILLMPGLKNRNFLSIGLTFLQICTKSSENFTAHGCTLCRRKLIKGDTLQIVWNHYKIEIIRFIKYFLGSRLAVSTSLYRSLRLLPTGTWKSKTDQKPNSWTYNFVEVSGHNLASFFRLKVSVYNVHTKNPFQTNFAGEGGGGGKIRLQRWLWIAMRKTLKTFVPITF